jgi:DNA repair protein RadC
MENIKQNIQVVAEIQLTYKSNVKPSLRPKVQTSREAKDIFLSTWDEYKLEFVEQFKIIVLNRANKVLGLFEVSSGSSTGTVADPKLIFAAAIKANASGIILAHNHPSGNLTPSQADIDLTRKLKEGGKFLEVQVLDHIIITIEGYYSFADEGLI